MGEDEGQSLLGRFMRTTIVIALLCLGTYGCSRNSAPTYSRREGHELDRVGHLFRVLIHAGVRFWFRQWRYHNDVTY
jgi:hypothetical protein